MGRRVAIYIAAALMGALCAFLLSGIFMVTTVMGSGMEPELDAGSRVVVNKLAYRSENPRAGDVVAVENHVYGEDGEGRVLIRRVAGSEGDSVEIKDSVFYRNGKPYTEHMVEAVHMDDMEKVELGKGELFLLSDNRSASLDSRDEAVGIVSVEQCIGKVCFE